MQPYTYYIYNTITKEHYYGVRFAKNCHPNELWNTYFTSSKKVHKLINFYGKDSFIFEIRKIFSDKQSAINWENKVLRRMKVLDKPNWLNMTTNKAILLPNDKQIEIYKKISKTLKGKKKSVTHVENMKKSRQNRTETQKKLTFIKQSNAHKGKKQKKTTIENRMKSIKNTIWINNGSKNLRIKLDDLCSYQDWNIGRKFKRKYNSPVYNITNTKTGKTFIMSRIDFCKIFKFKTGNIPSDKKGAIPITYKEFILTRLISQ